MGAQDYKNLGIYRFFTTVNFKQVVRVFQKRFPLVRYREH